MESRETEALKGNSRQLLALLPAGAGEKGSHETVGIEGLQEPRKGRQAGRQQTETQ